MGGTDAELKMCSCRSALDGRGEPQGHTTTMPSWPGPVLAEVMANQPERLTVGHCVCQLGFRRAKAPPTLFLLTLRTDLACLACGI